MNIFIDTQDMEERYGEELYKEYLENQNKEMKEKIDKAIEILKDTNVEMPTTLLIETIDYALKILEANENK